MSEVVRVSNGFGPDFNIEVREHNGLVSLTVKESGSSEFDCIWSDIIPLEAAMEFRIKLDRVIESMESSKTEDE